MTKDFLSLLRLWETILLLQGMTCDIALATSSSSNEGLHTDVEIFSTSNRAFTNSTDAALTCYIDKSAEQITDVYKLEAVATTEMQNNQMLADSIAAPLQKAATQGKLSTKLSKQYYKQLEMSGEAFYCIYEAKALGVQKLPAIVFDKKYVIYGETDVALALQQYKLLKDSKQYASTR